MMVKTSENDVPAAAGESAEVEGEHHHGAFDFGPPGGAGPVHPPPAPRKCQPRRHGDAEANEEQADEDDPDAGIEVDAKDHRSRGKWESSRGTPTCSPTDTEILSVSRVSRQR